jgi:hypothetical protein
LRKPPPPAPCHRGDERERVDRPVAKEDPLAHACGYGSRLIVVAMSMSEWTAPASDPLAHARGHVHPSSVLPNPVAMSVSEWTPPAAATGTSPRPVVKPRDPRRRWRGRADLPSAGGAPRRHGRHHHRKTPEERPTEPTEFTERDRMDPTQSFREIQWVPWANRPLPAQ